MGFVLKWDTRCRDTCLLPNYLAHSSVVDSWEPDLIGVPVQYHDLWGVFSEAQSQILLPHRLYDCAINLMPGTFHSRGRLFLLASSEKEAMEKYVREALRQVFIHPSSSAAEAGFFFVQKRVRTTVH